MNADFRCGFVAFIGRPNVGKSTLLNRLVGQKISITSQRPQTTRQRILGIKTTQQAQLVYVDTPGVHKQTEGQMSRYMNRAAAGSLEGVDCILLMISAPGWTEMDIPALELARQQSCPVILAINKIDKHKDRSILLPLIEASREKMTFAEIIPLSARSGDQVEVLEQCLLSKLPVGPAMFSADQVSDQNDRFMAAELVREQIFRSFGQEIPYAVAVQIEQFKDEEKLLRIEATIWVEKPGQKAILIGSQGERLKEIGRRARLGMQQHFRRKVYLGLWIKVRENWSDDLRALQTLGYADGS